MVKSWQTTLAGIAAFLAVFFNQITAQFDSDPATIADWNLVVGAAAVAIGLILARDNNKSSEKVGAGR